MNNIKTELKEVLSLEDLDITEKTTIKDVLNAYNSREDTTIKEAVGNMSFENDDADDEYLFPTVVEHYDDYPEGSPTLEYFPGKSPKMLAVIIDSVFYNDVTGETDTYKCMSLYKPLKLGDKFLACTGYDRHDEKGTGYLYELDENNSPQNIRYVHNIHVALVYGGGIPDHTVSPGVPDTALQYKMIVTEDEGTELYNGGISDLDTMDLVNIGINYNINRNKMYDGKCSFKVYSSDYCIAWLMQGSDSKTFSDNNKSLTSVNPLLETVVYETQHLGSNGGTD